MKKSMKKMKKAKEKYKLQAKYSFLKPTPINVGLMAFGFEHDDGWLPILEDLFEKIDKIVKEDNLTDFRVTQVKEKFAELNVYVVDANDKIYDLIDEATEKSLKLCEICGEKGKPIQIAGWWKTLCKKHEKERRAKREENEKKWMTFQT